MATNRPLMSVAWTSDIGNTVTITNRGRLFLGDGKEKFEELEGRAALLAVYEMLSARYINPQPEEEP